MHWLWYEPRTSVRAPATSARQNTRTIFWHMSSALNEEARVWVVATPPVGKKAFISEEIDQLILARSDRESLANTVIKFVAELGFVAWQRGNDLRKGAEAGGPAGGKGSSRQ